MSSSSHFWSRYEIRLVAGLISGVLLALFVNGWEQSRFAERQIGFVIFDTEEGLLINSVRPDSPAERAGLQAGDLIRSVQGMPIERTEDYSPAISSQVGGSLTLIVVDRNGERLDVGVQPGMPFPYFSFSATALTVLAYLLIGPLALRKRPGYLRSRILFLLSVAIAAEIAMPGIHTWINLWAAAGVLLSGIQLSLEFHLASVIPERQAWLDRWPWAIPTYYVFGLGMGSTIALGLLLEHFGLDWVLPWNNDALYSNYLEFVSPVWALGVLFLLGRQALVYPERQGRLQAGLVTLGVLPWAILVLSSELGWLSSWVPFRWEGLIWNAALLCYPLAVLSLLFQESTTQEKILLELTHRVHDAPSIVDVPRIVSDDLRAAFHPKTNQVFYRERHSRDLTLGHSSGPHLAEEVIPENSSLLRIIEASGESVDYPEDLQGLSPRDADWLDQLEARLLVPLLGRDRRLLGLLILGEKKSEEPYTRHDRDLLRALTTQISLVYENVRLEERVSESQQVHLELMASLQGEGLDLVKECPQCGACHDATEEVCRHDATELRPALMVERTIEGRYRLDQRLGKGGMGAIYRAHDLHLTREVAIKILLGNFVSGEASRRFETEARLTARLHHPNVVTLHDYGTTSTGAAYLVLEFLEGETLAERLSRTESLPTDQLASVVDQICLGVHEAHRQQVIHRDLKPANIFLSQQEGDAERVKVLDFGVAKVLDELRRGSGVTTPGALIGTFRYMSPEQLRGEEADARSDVFAIAVIAAEALTGRHPFPGDAPPKLLQSIAEGFRLRAEDSRQALEATLRRALSLDPADRFPTVKELQTEFVGGLLP